MAAALNAQNGHGLSAYIWDADEDRFTWAGDPQGVLGLPASDCPRTNARLHSMINPQQAAARLAALSAVFGHFAGAGAAGLTPPSFTLTYNIRRADGTVIEVTETATLRQDGIGGAKVLFGFLKVRETSAAQSSLPSALMGGVHAGRSYLIDEISGWAAGHPAGDTGYLVAAGIDRLGLMNDVFGARYVDELIDLAGRRLCRLAGDSAVAARIGGDVFGIFFTGAGTRDMATSVRHMLRHFNTTPLESSRGPVSIHLSMGGVAVHAPVVDSASLIVAAETALRAAKDKGRGCFVARDEIAGRADKGRQLLEMGDHFLRALKDDRVRLAFQPVMDSQTHDTRFHECLIRMMDADGTVHSAAKFMPAVESLGLNRMVDQYALRAAVHELSLFPDLQLSVNVSHLTLFQPDWLRNVVYLLRDKPAVARRLIIEMTETTAISDMRHTARIVATLKDLGCRVALDDFGSGYTAFTQLRDWNIDIVKIDKSFVRGMDQDENKLFVRTLQRLADGIDLETVGEGAETMADAARLADDGVDYVQGYVFGFPKVERVWLPKTHDFRQISLGRAPKESLEKTPPSVVL